MAQPENHDRYLGDGVYASYDGYHIWLAVNHHTNKVVALEPEVIDRFNEYVEHLQKLSREGKLQTP